MWRDHEIFKQAYINCRQYMDSALECIFGWEINTWADNMKHPLESPIEAAFYVWWVAGRVANEHQLRIVPQREVTVQIGSELRKYRVDFAVEPLDRLYLCFAEALGYGLKVAIELDGHEFHERTKEQVALRNRRDRDLQAHGWRVFHVSGSELVKDGKRQTQEVVEAVEREFENVRARMVHDLTGRDINTF